MNNETRKLTCPRCGDEHELEVKPLTRPVVDPDPADPGHPCTFQAWATCPATGEPILFKDQAKSDLMIPCPPDPALVAELAYRIWQAGSTDDTANWLGAERLLTRYFRVQSAAVMLKECGEYVRQDLVERCQQRVDRAAEDRIAAQFSYLLDEFAVKESR